MAHSVKWETTTTSRKVGSERVYDAAKQKNVTKSITKDVTYVYPIITTDTLEDFFAAVRKVLSDNKEGYKTPQMIMSHLQHGFSRHLAVMYNSGQDAKLTPEQLKTLKLYKTLVTMPNSTMTAEQAVSFLSLMGIENAKEVFEEHLISEEAETDAEEADAKTEGN